jgi:hypothetical protein
MLPGLMSLWIRPASCRACTAPATSAIAAAALRKSCFTRSSGRPSTSVIASQPSPTSKASIRCGCRTFEAARASRRKRSFAATFASFTATQRRSFVSQAFQTSDVAPSPSFSTSR